MRLSEIQAALQFRHDVARVAGMSWINRLERRLEPFAIPNLALYFVIGQTFVLLTGMRQLLDVSQLFLLPALVREGEWWRLFSFVFIPPTRSPLWVAFALYLFFLFGSALERQWGAVRFNLFLFLGYALTVGLAFVTPWQVATNLFLGGAVFLAFAWLFPEFEMMLFFVLPVKIKWLGLLAWLGYAWTFVRGDLSDRLGVLAAVGNFLIFFGRDLFLTIRQGGRQVRRGVARQVSAHTAPEARHRCVVCNRTDVSDPQMDFRYCSKCAGDLCYCADHLKTHEHVTSETPPAVK